MADGWLFLTYGIWILVDSRHGGTRHGAQRALVPGWWWLGRGSVGKMVLVIVVMGVATVILLHVGLQKGQRKEWDSFLIQIIFSSTSLWVKCRALKLAPVLTSHFLVGGNFSPPVSTDTLSRRLDQASGVGEKSTSYNFGIGANKLFAQLPCPFVFITLSQ